MVSEASWIPQDVVLWPFVPVAGGQANGVVLLVWESLCFLWAWSSLAQKPKNQKDWRCLQSLQALDLLGVACGWLFTCRWQW